MSVKDGITIKSDKKWKYIISGYDLPEKIWEDFGYMSYNQFKNGQFAKYRGQYYDINEFQRLPTIGDVSGKHVVYPVLRGWDGYANDTYYSGVVIKLSSDGERYKIGRFYS